MSRLIASLAAALAAGIMSPAYAAFGDRDCSFGAGGSQSVGTFGAPMAIAGDSGGNFIVRTGTNNTSTATSQFYRLDSHGTTSTELGSGTNIFMQGPEVVVQSDGGVLFTNGCGLSDCNGNPGPGSTPPGVGRLLPAGGLDTSFGSNGYATVAGLTSADAGPALQLDGRIVVGGKLNGSGGLVRFNSNGTPDAAFGSGGIAMAPAGIGTYWSVAIQSDGFILALGSGYLIRHRPDGQVDTTFGAGGKVSPSFLASRVHVQPSGKILVMGIYVTGVYRIGRYDASGALDTTVGNGVGYRDVRFNGEALTGGDYSPRFPFAVGTDGRPVVVGKISSGGAVVRFSVDLGDDGAFPLDFSNPSAALLLATGGVLVGSAQSGGGNVTRFLGDSESPSCIASTTTLSSAPNPSAYGQSVTLTANVTSASGPAPAGTVQFRNGASNLGSPVTLSAGVATLQLSTLPEGTSTLTATFSGGSGVVGSTSSPVSHVVNSRPTSTTAMSSSPNPSGCGQQITLAATVSATTGSGTPTGSVEFQASSSVGNVTQQAALGNGSATITWASPSVLRPGTTYSIRAVYSGDANFGPSTSPALDQVVSTCITINDPTAQSGPSPSVMNFTVSRLASSSASTIQVSYATADRSAIAGTDYTATSGTLTLNPGESTKGVSVPIPAQASPHPDKDFFLVLSSPLGAGLAKGAGVGTIRYASTDALSIYADDAVVVEGHSGVTLLGFTLSLNRFNNSPVTVSYATADGTAFAGSDYTSQSGTLTFARGVRQRWVIVPIAANTTVQPDRTLFLNLSNASGAVIARAQGTGTILDDDPAAPASTVPMYRLYSDVTKEHLYSTDANEYSVLGSSGWVQEGSAWTMFGNGTHAGQFTIPLYRMYHPGIRQHHWTTDANEIMVLASQGAWQYERIAGYLLPSAAAGSTPIYRLMYHSPPLHLWTIDANEKAVLSTQYGWIYEGIVGEVLP